MCVVNIISPFYILVAQRRKGRCMSDNTVDHWLLKQTSPIMNRFGTSRTRKLNQKKVCHAYRVYLHQTKQLLIEWSHFIASWTSDSQYVAELLGMRPCEDVRTCRYLLSLRPHSDLLFERWRWPAKQLRYWDENHTGIHELFSFPLTSTQ